jgi:energy-coupling factor transporter ATP-binding protein EcfA2
MPLKRLELKEFTVFTRATFQFARGINVLIGENATGKTHVLKVLYSIESMASRRTSHAYALAERLTAVFGAERAEALCREETEASVTVDWTKAHPYRFSFGPGPGEYACTPLDMRVRKPVFVPAREMLSVFPGFSQTVRNRELAFDDTYVDLADSLALPPMKGTALDRAKPLLRLVERALGGVEHEKGGRFLVKLEDGTFEAPLVAEGLRKVATLARLIRNGRIAAGVSLFWDEPETNLNPVLVRKVADVIMALARAGIQVFIASHDYLLTQTLSLHAEHPTKDTPSMRFFSLTRGDDGVTVASAATLAGIESNPILDEHARQYDLEADAFARDHRLREAHSD